MTLVFQHKIVIYWVSSLNLQLQRLDVHLAYLRMRRQLNVNISTVVHCAFVRIATKYVKVSMLLNMTHSTKRTISLALSIRIDSSDSDGSEDSKDYNPSSDDSN